MNRRAIRSLEDGGYHPAQGRRDSGDVETGSLPRVGIMTAPQILDRSQNLVALWPDPELDRRSTEGSLESAIEDARRILGEYRAFPSQDALRTVDRLFAVLDQDESRSRNRATEETPNPPSRARRPAGVNRRAEYVQV